jgi:Flp pilus assembly protein TadD
MKPRIYCSHCNAELRWSDKFCGNCGKPVDLSNDASTTSSEADHSGRPAEPGLSACRTCGTVNKPGTEFCKNCGADLRSQTPSEVSPKSATAKHGKGSERRERKEMKPLPLLGSWKPLVAVVVIIAAAVAIETYSTKQNIPADAIQLQSEQPQQPTGANMAALQQIQDMEQQVKANPANLDMMLHLANILNDNRFYDKAIKYYKMYLEKRPKDTNARVDMGICYKEIGSYDDAVREMKEALEYEPKHLFATYNLGIVALDEGKMCMDRGQMDKANELIRESNDWFRKTVALAPTSEVGKRAQQLLMQHSTTQRPQSN